MRRVPLLVSFAMAGCLVAATPKKEREQPVKQVEVSAGDKAKARAAWFRDHLRCEVRPLSKDEARSYARAEGFQSTASMINTSFMRLIRWPAENGSITDTWNQPINMTNSTSYIRDVLVGAHFFLTAAASGDSWNIIFHLPDGSTITEATPVTFTVNGTSGCWSGPWPTQCDQPQYSDVMWYLASSSQSNGDINYLEPGQYSMDVTYNGAVSLTTSFSILPQIEESRVPFYNQHNYTQPYADGTKTISQKGCALTDCCMVLGYFGVNVDPATLNTWLQNNNGYDGRKISWQQVAAYAHAAAHVNINYLGLSSNWFDSIAHDGPIVGRVNAVQVFNNPHHEHWVLPYGQQRQADGVSRSTDQWLVHDPNSGNFTHMNLTDIDTVRVFQGPGHTFVDSTMGLMFTFHCPLDFYLTDPSGRRAGVDPATGTTYSEIPGAQYIAEAGLTDDETGEIDSDVTKQLEAFNVSDGTYTLTATGTDTGTYAAEFDAFTTGYGSSQYRLSAIPILPGMVQKYTINYASASGSSYQVSGGLTSTFNGGGQSPVVNKFLTYAYPTANKTTLTTGATTTPVIIFYGPTTTPTTFKADLNGTDISAQFHPKAGGVEVVTLQGLTSGSNLLKLSIDGSVPSGHVATDTDRLTFDVP